MVLDSQQSYYENVFTLIKFPTISECGCTRSNPV